MWYCGSYFTGVCSGQSSVLIGLPHAPLGLTRGTRMYSRAAKCFSQR
jgi:hypothetical protein